LSDRTTRLVTVNTNGNASLGDFEHSNIALPREGGPMVAFDSTASDLVAGDLNGQSDVFVRDMGMNETRLISRRHNALPARTPPPMSGSWSSSSISGDGRVIAFTSLDNPSLQDDANISQDLFVRDTTTGSLRVITNQVLSQRSQAAVQPVLSRSGTHVSAYWTVGGAG